MDDEKECIIVCNNCEKQFEDEAALAYIEKSRPEDNFHGCPKCKSDSYLMDVEHTPLPWHDTKSTCKEVYGLEEHDASGDDWEQDDKAEDITPK